MNGTVITIVKHGLFVDVGSTRDGLVHVSDVSRDYFVAGALSRFSAGQPLEVWIKFVDPATNKLGLQLFAPRGAGADPTVASGVRKPVMYFPSETPVAGTVVKVSEFGVYVDIGATVPAFLSKRKMKLSRRQLKFKPWEVHPLHSTVQALVHEADRSRGRISLTTVPVEQWAERLPNKDFVVGAGTMIEDEEELGGSARALLSNTRSLERTLALSLDDEEDEGEDDEDGEALTEAEVNALTGGRRKAQLIIDETASTGSTFTQDRRTTAAPAEEGEELSTEELFDQLRGRKLHLTLADIKRWDYIRLINEDAGDGEGVSDEQLREIIEECGTGGKLSVEQFDQFLDRLVNWLKLAEAGGEEDVEEEEDEGSEEEIENNEEIEEDGEAAGESDSAADEISMDSDSREGLSLSLEDHFARRSGSSDLLAYVFGTVAGRKGHVLLEDLLQWDFAREMMRRGGVTEERLRALFAQHSEGSPSRLLSKGFEKIVDILGEIDITHSSFSTSAPTPPVPPPCPSDPTIPDNAAIIGAVASAPVSTSSAFIPTTTSAYSASLDIAPIKKIPAATALLKTSDELLRPGLVLPDQLSLSVSLLDPSLGLKEVGDFAADDFMAFSAEELEVEEGDDMDEEDVLELSVEEAFEELARGRDTMTMESLFQWEVVAQLVEDGAVNEQQLRALFKEAGGRKGRLDYDGFGTFLDLLMPYGDFESEEKEEGRGGDVDEDEDGTEDFNTSIASSARVLQLQPEEVSSSPISSGKREEQEELELEDISMSSEEDGDGEGASGDGVRFSRLMMGSATQNAAALSEHRLLTQAELDALDDEAILRNVFTALAGDKGLVSLRDLLNWDFVLDLFGQGELDEDTLKHMMADCGGSRKGLDIDAFDRLVDALVNLYGELEAQEGGSMDDDDDDDDDGDEEDDTSSSSSALLLMDETEALAPSRSARVSTQSAPAAAAVAVAEVDNAVALNVDLVAAFQQLSGGQSTFPLSELYRWELFRELVAAGHMRVADLDEVLRAAKISESDALDQASFTRVVEQLAVRFGDKDTSNSEQNEENDPDVYTGIDLFPGKNYESEDNEEEGEAEEEDYLGGLQEIFEELRGKQTQDQDRRRGAGTTGNDGKLSVKAFKKWDEIVELVEEGVLTSEAVEEALKDAEVTRGRMSFEQFVQVFETLQDEAQGDDEELDEEDDDDSEDKDEDPFSDDDDVYDMDTAQLAKDLKYMIDLEEQQRQARRSGTGGGSGGNRDRDRKK